MGQDEHRYLLDALAAIDPATLGYQEWVDGYCTGECPGGESRQSFTDRVTAAFSLIMDR